MKTDARVRYTQMMIRSSFLKLLKEKPVSRITVKEICELSEINRATFYHHYKDPYDLLERLEAELLQNLEHTLSRESFHDMESFYARILTSMKENGEWYIAICSAHGDTAFPVRIFLACYHIAFPMVAGRLSHLDDTDQNLVYQFLSQGSSGIMGYWLGSGMAEPIEKIAHFLAESTSAVMGHFAGKRS